MKAKKEGDKKISDRSKRAQVCRAVTPLWHLQFSTWNLDTTWSLSVSVCDRYMSTHAQIHTRQCHSSLRTLLRVGTAWGGLRAD